MAYKHGEPESEENPFPVTVVSTAANNRVPAVVAFFNPTHGIDMNVNAGFSGTPEGVHNGGDDVQWTGSNIDGVSTTFDSTDVFYAGAASVKVSNPVVGNSWQFLSASTVDGSDYVALTARVYINNGWDGNDDIEIYAWDSVGGVEVGTRVKLASYIDELQFKVWHPMVIALCDMAIEGATFDAIRMELVAKTAAGPTFYIDKMQLEEEGNPIAFDIVAPRGKTLYIEKIRFTFVSTKPATLLNGTVANVSYDEFAGIPALTNGLTLQTMIDGEISFSAGTRQLIDFIAFGVDRVDTFGDADSTTIVLETIEAVPIILKEGSDQNFLRAIISDDLSALLRFYTVVVGSMEDS